MNQTKTSTCIYHRNSQRRIVRRGFVMPLVATALVLMLLVGSGVYFFFIRGETSETFSPIVADVTRGEFVAHVLDQGEVQSSENVEIRCEAKARNGLLTVLRAVPEGTFVKEGDFLVQLDATGYEKELEQQKVVMANAETQKIQAETTVETAKATLKEYLQGTFVEAKKMIENEIFDAESLIATSLQNLKQAETNFEHNKKLAAKAYITPQALESAEFAVKNAQIQVRKARNMLELAEQKMEVLLEITSKKFILQYEADIKAAEVTLRSQTEAYEVEKNKIAEIERMYEKCLIKVPKGVSGQVVFAKESSRGGQDWVLEEGGTVRENQVLIRLPNPNKMEVKALINEQSITQVAVGMPAKIRVDALNNQELKGVVTKVNQYAEQSGWMSTSIRKYAVFVRIINPPESLKPGMNSSVSIQTQYKEDALIAPIQTIYGVQDKQYCLVKKGENGWETREVKTAGENAQHVLIDEGLKVGEKLVMNPGAYKEYMDLPEVKLVNRIELSDDDVAIVRTKPPSGGVESAGRGGPRPPEGEEGGRPPEGESRAGMRNLPLPANAKVVIQELDQDKDAKLSRDEAGEPYGLFFDRIDTDADGFLSEEELDASLKMMRQMRANGGRSRNGETGAAAAPNAERGQSGSAGGQTQ
jgi:HlyD family secretion protein